MKTKYIEIIIEKPLSIQMTVGEFIKHPCHFLEFKEFEAKMIKVSYKLMRPEDETQLLKSITKALTRIYKAVKVTELDELKSIK